MTIEDIQQLQLSIKRGEYIPLFNDLLTGKAMIVDKEWLDGHDKQIIDKACEYFRKYNEQCEIQEMVNIADFRKAMEE